MRKEKLAALLGIPAAVAGLAALGAQDRNNVSCDAADIFSKELDNAPRVFAPNPIDQMPFSSTSVPEIPPPNRQVEVYSANQNGALSIATPEPEATIAIENPASFKDDIPNYQTEHGTIYADTVQIVPENSNPQDTTATQETNTKQNSSESLPPQSETVNQEVMQQNVVTETEYQESIERPRTTTLGQNTVEESHEEPAVETQTTYQDQKDRYQPSQEAVGYLTQALSNEIGNNPTNWEIRVRNALSFARFLWDNPDIVQNANNFTPTPEQVGQMENKFQELQDDYEKRGNEASVAAKAIALGVENKQLGSQLFSQMGEPLDYFDTATFLMLWGTEETWLITSEEIPANWHSTGFVTNPLKGVPYGAVTIQGYDPNNPEHSIYDTIAAARYFQNQIDSRGNGQTKRKSDGAEWMHDAEWLSRWNPASDLWHERMGRYRKVLLEFVNEFPEYSFLFKNIVDKNITEVVSFSKN